MKKFGSQRFEASLPRASDELLEVEIPAERPLEARMRMELEPPRAPRLKLKTQPEVLLQQVV